MASVSCREHRAETASAGSWKKDYLKKQKCERLNPRSNTEGNVSVALLMKSMNALTTDIDAFLTDKHVCPFSAGLMSQKKFF